MNHILANAKAYAALVGSVLTAVLASAPHVPTWLGIVAAVCTAVTTWTVPNAATPSKGQDGAVEPGSLAVGLVLGLIVVWLILR
jgi:hypothetical protein